MNASHHQTAAVLIKLNKQQMTGLALELAAGTQWHQSKQKHLGCISYNNPSSAGEAIAIGEDVKICESLYKGNSQRFTMPIVTISLAPEVHAAHWGGNKNK